MDDLRQFFGVAGSHERFDNFRKKVIERAITEVNEVAEFEVSVEYVRGGLGGKVIEARFTAASKSHARLMDVRALIDPLGRGRTAARDANTVDLLDGRTDSERGGSAGISNAARERAQEMVGESVVQYEEDWRREMVNRSEERRVGKECVSTCRSRCAPDD